LEAATVVVVVGGAGARVVVATGLSVVSGGDVVVGLALATAQPPNSRARPARRSRRPRVP
jgi:hypothetical protein